MQSFAAGLGIDEYIGNHWLNEYVSLAISLDIEVCIRERPKWPLSLIKAGSKMTQKNRTLLVKNRRTS